MIDKVTLDMGYESLKAKQKEAIMLFFLTKERRITNGFGKGVSITSYCILSSYVLLYGFPEQTDVQHATTPFLMVWVWLARLD